MDVAVSDASEQRPAAPASGRDERMQALYDAHATALFRFLKRLTFGDSALAEDLLQETLVRAWRNLDALGTDVKDLRPWLYTVARRIAIDHGRSRASRPNEVIAVDTSVFPSTDGGLGQVITMEIMRQALATLTPAQRVALIEVYYLGTPAVELARRLGVPIGTIKSRMFYALRALRETLEDAGF